MVNGRRPSHRDSFMNLFRSAAGHRTSHQLRGRPFSAAAAAMAALDDCLCTPSSDDDAGEETAPIRPPPTSGFLAAVGGSHTDRAWGYWKRLGAPKLVVAPMVDNSELPFRMLCRRYGAQAAYTPMLHSRIFSENEKYRSMEFTTCKVDKYVCCDHCFASCTILLLLVL